ncbi:MAG: phosphotransferase family protein [Candidatus Izemoplasmataceae bacterium]
MKINHWDDWSKLYMDSDYFKPIIEKILLRHQLPLDGTITAQGFSTNAVFKINDIIVKIFAPKKSGANTPHDYYVEVESIQALSHLIDTPKILGNGLIKSKYNFYYVVTSFIDGLIARDYFKTLSIEERFTFGKKIRHLTNQIHLSKPSLRLKPITKRYLIHNKLNSYHPSFKEEIFTFLDHYDTLEYYYIHGDITEDNIIITPKEKIVLLDYADSGVGPIAYEYPPIMIGLFDLDKQAFLGFIGNDDVNDHIECLFTGMLIHEYAGDFIHIFLKKIGVKREDLRTLNQLKTALYAYYKNNVHR